MPVHPHPELLELWLPILVSAVLAFFASFITWSLLPFHHKHWRGFPDEATMAATLRPLPPGNYTFPYCKSPKDLKDPAVKARFDAGPHGILHMWAERRPMPLCMGASFVVNIVVSLLVAYLAASTLARGAPLGEVFRVTATAGILAYTMGHLGHSIWFGKTLAEIVLDIIDGLVYGLATAAPIAWMWPKASTLTG